MMCYATVILAFVNHLNLLPVNTIAAGTQIATTLRRLAAKIAVVDLFKDVWNVW